jgi:uncharacterized pyridoxamine 5'-phosphate oxidase family protein
MISADFQGALQGILPGVITTVSKDNIPNLSYISQVHYVDEEHLAISWQFFNKTYRNIQDNPNFSVLITSPTTFSMWKIDLRFVETLREGDLFDEMEMALEAIASMYKAEDVFKLQAIVIGKIVSIENQFDGFES